MIRVKPLEEADRYENAARVLELAAEHLREHGVFGIAQMCDNNRLRLEDAAVKAYNRAFRPWWRFW